jgi:hypothetical protein
VLLRLIPIGEAGERFLLFRGGPALFGCQNKLMSLIYQDQGHAANKRAA